MKPRPKNFAGVLVASATIALAIATAALLSRAHGQLPNATSPAAINQMNLNLVVLDPAHGGPDAGAVLGSNVVEKDITLTMAAQLRVALTAAGFTVIATRDTNSDSTNPLTNDQRAEIANHARAVACVVLHATNTGTGVHVYTSTLSPAESGNENDGAPSAFVPLPWEMAQAGSVQQSDQLADDLRSGLAAGNLPVVVGKAAVRPLDNLMCPAVAVELAPLGAGSDATPVTDADYQQRVAGVLAEALRAWRAQATPQAPQQGPQ